MEKKIMIWQIFGKSIILYVSCFQCFTECKSGVKYIKKSAMKSKQIIKMQNKASKACWLSIDNFVHAAMACLELVTAIYIVCNQVTLHSLFYQVSSEWWMYLEQSYCYVTNAAILHTQLQLSFINVLCIELLS